MRYTDLYTLFRTIFTFLIFCQCSVIVTVTGAHASGATPYDNKSAAIYVYHRIGEDPFPETSIRKNQFEVQIREILSGDYNVVALPELVENLREEKNLPRKTIALSFDGGHKSVLTHAVPLLTEHDLPFTVFFSPGKADLDSQSFLNWRDLKTLARNRNVSFGLHPAAYERLSGEPDQEIRKQINNAKARFREMLGREARFFAYPFGEYGNDYKEIISASGFEAAFGQESAIAYPGSDFYELPRFTMTESFADLGRFTLTANALPLPVTDVEPEDSYITEEISSVGFTLHPALTPYKEELSCFISEPGQLKIEFLGDGRAELRGMDHFVSSRVRINCTMPGPETDEFAGPRWRWHGMFLTVSDEYLNRHNQPQPPLFNQEASAERTVTPQPDEPRQLQE